MSDKRLQVFLSSKMRRNVLAAERQAARNAIMSLGVARVWDWETCGYADWRPPLEVCLQAVRESNALVLILGHDLTDHTRREHREAVKHNIPDFIFVKGSPRLLNQKARRYLRGRASRCKYQPFGSADELQTYIQSGLSKHIVEVYLAAWQLGIGTRSSNARYPRTTRVRSAKGSGGKP